MPLAEIIISPFSSSLVLLFSKPFSVIFFSVSKTYFFALLKSTTESHGICPPQYSETLVFGVPPPISVTISANVISFHSLINYHSCGYSIRLFYVLVTRFAFVLYHLC